MIIPIGVARLSVTSGKLGDALTGCAVVSLLALCVAYIVARLGLIALIFYCFCLMPAGVYETVQWTDFVPHVA